MLNGGADRDVLEGGAGLDEFAFDTGSGLDVVVSQGAESRINDYADFNESYGLSENLYWELSNSNPRWGESVYQNQDYQNLVDDERIPEVIRAGLSVIASGDGADPLDARTTLEALQDWLHEGSPADLFPGGAGFQDMLSQTYEELRRVRIDEGGGYQGDGYYDNQYWQEIANPAHFANWDATPGNVRYAVEELANYSERGEAILHLETIRDWLSEGVAEPDTLVMPDGVEAGSLEVQTSADGNAVAIGYGGDDAIVIQAEGGVLQGSVQQLRFADGSTLSLADLIADADDGGEIGLQYGSGDGDWLIGSVADDQIYAGDGDDAIRARNNNDFVFGEQGADVISAGSGADQAYGGDGDDVIAGEAGDDILVGGAGNDTYVFNRGDGVDRIFPNGGGSGDTVSFGVGVGLDHVSAYQDQNGNLVLAVDGGTWDRVELAWFDPATREPLADRPVGRVQFVAADGSVRVFDLAGLADRAFAALSASDADHQIALFDDPGAFELTGLEAPHGGGNAVAYAQTGGLFAQPYFASGNPATEGDDVIVGDGADDEVDGGDGDDLISTGGGDDVIAGGYGNNTIDAGDGDDVIDAGTGNHNQVRGGAGYDTFVYYRGDGVITIDDFGANLLRFEPGITFEEISLTQSGGYLELRLASAGDVIRFANFDPEDPFGTAAFNAIDFDDGDYIASYEDLLAKGFEQTGTPSGEILRGSAMSDSITGLAGNDLILGGAGADELAGGLGADEYLFLEGDGHDILIDQEREDGRNVVRFGEGIDAGGIEVGIEASASGMDLVIYYGSAGDSIRLPGFDLANPAVGLPFDAMRFADGTELSLFGLIANGLFAGGTPEADTLSGGPGADVLLGFESDDTLAGGAGDDTYVVLEGGGLDTIIDSADVSAGPTERNTVLFTHAGLASLDQLLPTFNRAARTMTVWVDNTDDGVVLTNFDPDDPMANRVIDRFVLGEGGPEFSFADLLARGFSISGSDDGEVFLGSAARDHIEANGGNDVLAAGQGGGIAEGGEGDDLYVYNKGDGVLLIRDQISLAPGNTLQFGEGVTLESLRNTLKFTAPDPNTGAPGVLRILLGGGDEVAIEGFDPLDAEHGEHAVEHFRFADGASISYRDLVQSTFIVQGDEFDNALTGTNIGDRLYGFEGNDELHAGDGNDTLTPGTGDDIAEGGAGRDMYVFNRGDGSDTIVDDGAGFEGNFIAFGPGIAQADISFTRDGR